MSRAQAFQPAEIQVFKPENSRYVYTDIARTAVQVALATKRPLLVRGAPGCGKSTLARNVALTLKWRYREVVITSRTQAKDLAYRFDALRKLQDAHGQKFKEDIDYVAPAALFWAFAPQRANDLPRVSGLEQRVNVPCVVLLDEIDKADPDVPNDLLVTLEELSFVIEETGETVRATEGLRPLLIATTNNERSLPSAFLRRCIVLDLPPPDLLRVAETHFGEQHRTLYRAVLTKHEEIVAKMTEAGLRAPSTAEYLDAVEACRALGTERLAEIASLALEKEHVSDA